MTNVDIFNELITSSKLFKKCIIEVIDKYDLNSLYDVYISENNLYMWSVSFKINNSNYENFVGYIDVPKKIKEYLNSKNIDYITFTTDVKYYRRKYIFENL